MKLSAPGVSKLFIRRSVINWLIVILLFSFGVYWFHFHGNRNNNAQQVDVTPSRSSFVQPEADAANKSLKNKDYLAAANLYLEAASDASGTNQPKLAKSLLVQATTQIPAQYVPWYVYNALAQVARQLGDTSLEKQNLSLALQKASVPGTDISPEQLNGIKARQGQLK